MVRIKVGDKRKYVIPLRKEWLKAPRWRRSKRAVDAVHKYIFRHTKVENIKISNWLNQELWKHGGKNPPAKVEVEVKVENRKVTDKKTKKDIDVPFAVAELATLPKRAERLDKKREKKSEKFKKTAKPEAKVTGKEPTELAKELKKKIADKVKKKKEEPKEKKKSAKELAAELHKAEQKEQAKVTKAQELGMHK